MKMEFSETEYCRNLSWGSCGKTGKVRRCHCAAELIFMWRRSINSPNTVSQGFRSNAPQIRYETRKSRRQVARRKNAFEASETTPSTSSTDSFEPSLKCYCCCAMSNCRPPFMVIKPSLEYCFLILYYAYQIEIATIVNRWRPYILVIFHKWMALTPQISI
jgi:hypothetical protein